MSKSPPTVDVLMLRPGASKLIPGARFEKDAIVSVGGVVVAPTLMAEPIQAGTATVPLRPSFPEATTVAIPSVLRSWTNVASSGKVASHGIAKARLPRLRLMAAIGGIPGDPTSVSLMYSAAAISSDGKLP